jgi:Tfp pilus assembly protein PilF
MDKKMIEAQEALRNRKFQEALDIYNQEIIDDPNNALAYHGAAVSLFNLKKIDDAVIMDGKALAIEPNLALSHVLLAEVYDVRKDIENSWKEIKIAYDLDPDSAEILTDYGTFLLRDGQIDDAIAMLERAAQIDPNFYAIHHNLSYAYLCKKNFKGHYIHKKEIFRLRPSFYNSLQFVFSFINVYSNVLSLIFLIIVAMAFVTKLWLLLIMPYTYFAFLVIGSVLLKLTKKK